MARPEEDGAEYFSAEDDPLTLFHYVSTSEGRDLREDTRQRLVEMKIGSQASNHISFWDVAAAVPLFV